MLNVTEGVKNQNEDVIEGKMKKPKIKMSFLAVVIVLLIFVVILATSGFVGYEVYSSFGDNIDFYGKMVSVVVALFVALLAFMGVNELMSK